MISEIRIGSRMPRYPTEKTWSKPPAGCVTVTHPAGGFDQVFSVGYLGIRPPIRISDIIQIVLKTLADQLGFCDQVDFGLFYAFHGCSFFCFQFAWLRLMVCYEIVKAQNEYDRFMDPNSWASSCSSNCSVLTT